MYSIKTEEVDSYCLPLTLIVIGLGCLSFLGCGWCKREKKSNEDKIIEQVAASAVLKV